MVNQPIYKFEITNGRFGYYEIYSTNDLEWIDNYSESEKIDKEIFFNELRKNHILFGIMESLVQNDDAPDWFMKSSPENDRHIKVSWKKL